MALFSWNQIINTIENPHLLQTTQWAAGKSRYGWIPHYLAWFFEAGQFELIVSLNGEFQNNKPAAAALVLERKILPGFSVLYVPKGPLLGDWSDHNLRDQVLYDLENFAKKNGALQLKIDPDVIVGRGVPGEEGFAEMSEGLAIQDQFSKHGWHFSPEQIQFRNTILIDLKEEEDQLLARMKSKTRYNIRLSSRKGITVRQGDQSDLASLYRMYANTSVRGSFTIRGEEYYLSLWKSFMGEDLDTDQDPVAQPLIAELDGDPVAGAVIFKFGEHSWYLHGMSLPAHSDKMAPHLIQWEAIRWAKNQGCSTYDMWGAPDRFDETDPMWGVYRFKRGYNGEVVHTVGAWDFPVRPFYYTIYTRWVPRLLNIMRWFGNRQTRQITTEDPNKV